MWTLIFFICVRNVYNFFSLKEAIRHDIYAFESLSQKKIAYKSVSEIYIL